MEISDLQLMILHQLHENLGIEYNMNIIELYIYIYLYMEFYRNAMEYTLLYDELFPTYLTWGQMRQQHQTTKTSNNNKGSALW